MKPIFLSEILLVAAFTVKLTSGHRHRYLIGGGPNAFYDCERAIMNVCPGIKFYNKDYESDSGKLFSASHWYGYHNMVTEKGHCKNLFYYLNKERQVQCSNPDQFCRHVRVSPKSYNGINLVDCVLRAIQHSFHQVYPAIPAKVSSNQVQVYCNNKWLGTNPFNSRTGQTVSEILRGCFMKKFLSCGTTKTIEGTALAKFVHPSTAAYDLKCMDSLHQEIGQMRQGHVEGTTWTDQTAFTDGYTENCSGPLDGNEDSGRIPWKSHLKKAT